MTTLLKTKYGNIFPFPSSDNMCDIGVNNYFNGKLKNTLFNNQICTVK